MVLLYALSAAILLIILNLGRNKYRKGLFQIPGPTLAAYTTLSRLYGAWKGGAHLDDIEAHRKYGNVVRVGPNHVSVADPKYIPVFYGTKDDYRKTHFYDLLAITWKKQLSPNIFSTTDADFHRVERRKQGNIFALTNLLQFEENVNSCVDLLIRRLDQLVDEGKPIDLGEWLQYFAFDVIGEITFGRMMGCMEQSKDVDGIIVGSDNYQAYCAVIGQYPAAHQLLLGNPLLRKVIPPMETWNPVMLYALKAIHESAVKVDADAVIYEGEGKDMMSRWASVKLTDPNKMNMKDFMVHLLTMVFGGSDTTSIALRSIFYFLCKNPKCMKRLVEEIDRAEFGQRITYKKASELPYLQAVMRESMRLHPSVGMMLERYVPSEGVEVDGYFLEGGTIVGINPWVTSRNEDIFPDPEKFKPERWLTDSEHLKVMENTWEFVFGAGLRKCVGRNIACMLCEAVGEELTLIGIEMQKVVPELLRHFTIGLTESEKDWTVKNHL